MHLMSNATTWGNEGLEGRSEQKFASAKITAAFLICVLLIILSACTLTLLEHTAALANVADRIEKVTRWILLLGAAGASAGTLSLLVLLSRFRAWQTEWTERVIVFVIYSAAFLLSLLAHFVVERYAREQLETRLAETAERNSFLDV